jgi:hypothetical protein
MTIFLRLVASRDKARSLRESCEAIRMPISNDQVFEVSPEAFHAVPGSPFAYWVSQHIRDYFKSGIPFRKDGRYASVGASTKDNFRYTRFWTEISASTIATSREETSGKRWVPFAMGGKFSPYYRDIDLVINWLGDGRELKAALSEYRGSRGWGYQWSAALNGHDYYFCPGLTWPLRASRFAPQAMPFGCIFSGRGYAAFVPKGDHLETLAIFNSVVFDFIFKVALGRFGYPEFLVGVLHYVPFIKPQAHHAERLRSLARRAWSIKRAIDTIEETSHAFLLPASFQERFFHYDRLSIEFELSAIQTEIDNAIYDLYALTEADRAAAQSSMAAIDEESVGEESVGEEGADEENDDDADEDDEELSDSTPIDESGNILSWCVGVAFGRFDWRLATGGRAAPPEPDPFDPLPAKSPGMLPDGAAPFHPHPGLLVDDSGHPHDLPRLVEEVLGRVETQVPPDVRRWLQREFFPFHLQRYSKSRRKAPIYWPLATESGSYTLWLYYPSLTSQTLYSAVNDFVEPKLKQVEQQAGALRGKGTARSRDEDRALEALQTLEQELIELRDTLLRIAPTYRPNHDDGVQITAAPLWKLFRHKPWQKLLKETWAKLEKGEYDWSHIAMTTWPDRVREKCKTDKSLAIAHDLEQLYVEPPPPPAKPRGRRKGG